MLFSPFVAIVEFLFLWSLRLTRDPGVAVLCLSLALSLLLLPLFLYIEKLKRRQKGIQRAMQGALDEIEAVYQGRERYYYTREVHRLHGYSPLAALIPSLGLLVQIPFLLAAYRYLSTYAGFEGVSFLYIDNLNQPDTIAQIASLPINLLPLVMTAVNLYSGWLYGKDGKPSERLQYMGVALLFLILLYAAPASVLLYWTCSNVLAVARMRLTNPEVFCRSFDGKDAPWESTKPLATVPWRGIYSGALFFSTYMFLAASLYHRPADPNNYRFVLWLVVGGSVGILSAQLIGLRAVYLAERSNRVTLPFVLRLTLSLQFVFVTLILLRTFTDFPIGSSPILSYLSLRAIPNALFLSILVNAICLPSVWRLFWSNPTGHITAPDTPKGSFLLFLSSAAYCAGLVMIWLPMIVFSSGRSSFSFTERAIVVQGFFHAFLLLLFCVTTWKLVLWRWSREVSIFVAICAAIAFTYAFLVPVRLGTLQGQQLVEANALAKPPAFFAFDFCLLVGVVVLVTYGVRVFGRKKVAALVLIAHLVAATQAVIAVRKEKSASTDNPATTASSEYIRFSRNHDNVLIVLLDMVRGTTFGQLASAPHIAPELDGFVHFPNTLSVANMTIPSMPAIYAGADYMPDRINADGTRTLREQYIRAAGNMADAAERGGFRFSHHSADSVGLGGPLSTSAAFSKTVLAAVGGQSTSSQGQGRYLFVLRSNALLQSAPLFLKALIYRDGQWLRKTAATDTAFTPYSQEHPFFEALPLISFCDESGPGEFNFVHTEVTHNPWGIPDAHGVMRATNERGVLEWALIRLGVWFQWMKHNGVYDNTRIVLVSDHGLVNRQPHEFNPATDPFRNRHLWPELARGVPSQYGEHRIQMFDSLLALKDFGAKGRLERNGQLMSSVDVGALALRGSKAISTDRGRTARAFLVVPPSQGGFQPLKTFNIAAVFEVQGDLFDLSNWCRVDRAVDPQ